MRKKRPPPGFGPEPWERPPAGSADGGGPAPAGADTTPGPSAQAQETALGVGTGAAGTAGITAAPSDVLTSDSHPPGPESAPGRSGRRRRTRRFLTRPGSRKEVATELRRLSAGRPLNLRQIPQPIQHVAKRLFGNLDRARRAAGVKAPPPWRKWTRDGVVRELGRLHRTGARLTLRGLKAVGMEGLLGAAQTIFGGLVRARRAAGVPDPERAVPEEECEWDEGTIVREIQARDRAGEPLAVTKAPGNLVSSAERYFGSWRKAIEAAGLDYDRILLVRAFREEELLARLRRIAALPPDRRPRAKAETSLIAAVRRRFGSVAEAARLAGVDLTGWPPPQERPVLTRAATLAALRERHGQETPDTARRLPHDWPLLRAVQHHFPTWHDALKAADLADAPHIRAWDEGRIVDALVQRRKAGQSLLVKDIMRDDPGLGIAAARRFGSVGRALAAMPPRPGRSRSSRPRTRRRFPWRPAALKLLGTDSDRRVAQRIGASVQEVAYMRARLGIASFIRRRWRQVAWTPGMTAQLGERSDADVARRLGLALATVAKKRHALGIPSAGSRRRSDWTPAMLLDLRTLRPHVVAAKYGIRASAVAKHRIRLGLPPLRSVRRR